MKKYLHILLLFCSHVAFGQFYWDIGVNIGPSNYLGDIGGKDKPRRDFIWDMKLQHTRFDAGAFVRYKFHPDIAVRLDINWIRLYGSDRYTIYPHRRARNITFRNNIIESTLMLDYYFYTVNDVGNTGRYRNDFRAYVTAGIGGMYHNPQAPYNGKWYALRPLKTEGQVKPYPKFGMVIPFGMGFFYTIDRRYKLGLELVWRKTFTDYLDDVSTNYPNPPLSDPIAAALSNPTNQQVINEVRADNNIPSTKGPTMYTYRPGAKRGDPSHKDNYFTVNVKFSYSLRSKSKFYRAKYTFLHGKRKKRRKARAKF